MKDLDEILSIEKAYSFLEDAPRKNKELWIKHSVNVAIVAERLAEQLKLDSKKAYVLGLVHDIGRRKKEHVGLRHIIEGYNFLEEQGYKEESRETYTGTKLEGRKEFENLLKIIKKGDTLIFDSVSRMSRNSEEGCNLYEDLFNKGINLIFLKEGYINTEVYRKALDNQINIVLNTGNKATDELMQTIISALNKYTLALAKEQIKKAFDQAEKEVKDLHTRTSEGILTARLDGKQIGLTKGTKLTTK